MQAFTHPRRSLLKSCVRKRAMSHGDIGSCVHWLGAVAAPDVARDGCGMEAELGASGWKEARSISGRSAGTEWAWQLAVGYWLLAGTDSAL